MNDEWKGIFEKHMQQDFEDILEEINKDPRYRDIEAPEVIHDRLFARIHAREEQKKWEILSDDDRELIRLGREYRRKRKRNRYVVLVAAVVTVLALGTVSIGKNENILTFLKQMIAGYEQTVSDSGSTEPTHYIEEQEVFEKIESTYNFSPVKLEYLPQQTVFQEAVSCTDMQGINMYYGTSSEANVIYTIRPNYRESSFAIIIEDEKLREYTMNVNEVEISLAEYYITDASENRWLISFVYQDVQYWLRITNLEKTEVERIVNTLSFFE